jgi:hypothetical protein
MVGRQNQPVTGKTATAEKALRYKNDVNPHKQALTAK